jgi:hypothetical protein
MTEKDIVKSINKYSGKSIIALAILIFAMDTINNYFFNSDVFSPMLIIILSIGVCMYTVQKVLVDLLVVDIQTSANDE